ncbi:MAG: glycosyltransferase family 9 protein, partial [Deltaproteobacteria bacterium]|nr:glycosyltransferase family 9 protein [Deltaproteobacteria bacterium]
MNIDLQRRIDRIAGSLLCGLFSLVPGTGRQERSGDIPSKILVILLSEMGSLLLATPMFEYMRRRYPKTSLYVLLFERNREFLEILDVVPRENILSVDGNSLSGLLKSSLKAIKRMRKENIDTVLDCELFARVSSIYSYLSGAKIRVGFHPYTQEGLFRGNYINRPVLYNPYRHMSLQFLALAKAMESKDKPMVKESTGDGCWRGPVLNLEPAEISRFRERLEHDFPCMSGRNLVLVYPSGGLLPIRAWPLENFCIVAEELTRRGFSVGIIGMEDDRDLAQGIVDRCRSKNCINLAGYTRTLRELLILFHLSSLLITNDGGPGHFASMTPVPAIILYGPETPVLYGSLDPKAVNLYVPTSCSPCLTAYNHRNSPCDGNNLCLKSIDPGMVLERAYEILNRRSKEDLNSLDAGRAGIRMLGG